MDDDFNVGAALRSLKLAQKHLQELGNVRERFFAHLKLLPVPSCVEQFSVAPNGTLELVVLGLRLEATQRLARMHEPAGELVFAWDFTSARGERVEKIWTFYLTKGGWLLDEGSGAFAGAPSVTVTEFEGNDVVDEIVARAYHALMKSDLMQP